MTEMDNINTITTMEEFENKIKDYEDKQKFLLKVISYMYSAGHFSDTELFRTDKSDGYSMIDHRDCSQFVPYASMVVKTKDFSYEDYSNLPEKGRLLYSKISHIVFADDMRKIYGYLDHENKTLVKIELEYDSETGSHKFL